MPCQTYLLILAIIALTACGDNGNPSTPHREGVTESVTAPTPSPSPAVDIVVFPEQIDLSSQETFGLSIHIDSTLGPITVAQIVGGVAVPLDKKAYRFDNQENTSLLTIDIQALTLKQASLEIEVSAGNAGDSTTIDLEQLVVVPQPALQDRSTTPVAPENGTNKGANPRNFGIVWSEHISDLQKNTILLDIRAVVVSEMVSRRYSRVQINESWPINYDALINFAERLASRVEIESVTIDSLSSANTDYHQYVRNNFPRYRQSLELFPYAVHNLQKYYPQTAEENRVGIAILESSYTEHPGHQNTELLGYPAESRLQSWPFNSTPIYEWPGDTITEDADSDCLTFHGTYVTGIIADADVGFANDHQVKIALHDGALDIAENLERFLADDDTSVISISFAIDSDAPILYAITEDLREAGKLVIVANGNLKNGVIPQLDWWPHNDNNTISVGGAAYDESTGLFSRDKNAINSDTVDIYAPFTFYTTTMNIEAEGTFSPKHEACSGTSGGAPFVAAIVARMCSENRARCNFDDILARLKENAFPDSQIDIINPYAIFSGHPTPKAVTTEQIDIHSFYNTDEQLETRILVEGEFHLYRDYYYSNDNYQHLGGLVGQHSFYNLSPGDVFGFRLARVNSIGDEGTPLIHTGSVTPEEISLAITPSSNNIYEVGRVALFSASSSSNFLSHRTWEVQNDEGVHAVESTDITIQLPLNLLGPHDIALHVTSDRSGQTYSERFAFEVADTVHEPSEPISTNADNIVISKTTPVDYEYIVNFGEVGEFTSKCSADNPLVENTSWFVDDVLKKTENCLESCDSHISSFKYTSSLVGDVNVSSVCSSADESAVANWKFASLSDPTLAQFIFTIDGTIVENGKSVDIANRHFSFSIYPKNGSRLRWVAGYVTNVDEPHWDQYVFNNASNDSDLLTFTGTVDVPDKLGKFKMSVYASDQYGNTDSIQFHVYSK